MYYYVSLWKKCDYKRRILDIYLFIIDCIVITNIAIIIN